MTPQAVAPPDPTKQDEDRVALERLLRRGWHPRCIYDIGASNGEWTYMAAEIFPLAEFHLFEPLADVVPEYRAGLDGLVKRPGLRVTVHTVALDDTAGIKRFGVGPTAVGSSLLVDTPSEWFPEVTDVSTVTLDEYRASHTLPIPELLKADTQGSELRILRGATALLPSIEALILETWLLRGYGAETPLLHEVAGFLLAYGFSAADLMGTYRDPDDRLVSQDVLFLRDGAVP